MHWFHDISSTLINHYQSPSVSHHHLRVRDDMTPNSLRFSFLVQINIDTCTIPASTRVLRASPLAHHAMHHHAQLATSPVAHPRRIPGSHASPRVHWPPARQSWQSTLPVPADASSYSSVQDARRCTRCMASRPCVSPARFYCLGGRNLDERDLPCPSLFMSRCSSLPSHPILSSTYIPPPLSLASNQRHQI